MNYKYINIYNNLVSLTRNKDLYKNFNKQDEFSDRLVLLLIHLAFFFKFLKMIIIRQFYKIFMIMYLDSLN